MLRQKYISKFCKRTKNDLDQKYINDNDYYILEAYKPLPSKFLTELPKNTLYTMVDDVLYNNDINKILYSSNFKAETKLLKRGHDAMVKNMSINKKSDVKSNPTDIFFKRKKLETIEQIKNEAIKFKKAKNEYHSNLTNDNKLNRLIKSKENEVNEIKSVLYNNRILIERFDNVFNSLSDKFKNYEYCLNELRSIEVLKTEDNYDNLYTLRDKINALKNANKKRLTNTNGFKDKDNASTLISKNDVCNTKNFSTLNASKYSFNVDKETGNLTNKQAVNYNINTINKSDNNLTKIAEKYNNANNDNTLNTKSKLKEPYLNYRINESINELDNTNTLKNYYSRLYNYIYNFNLNEFRKKELTNTKLKYSKNIVLPKTLYNENSVYSRLYNNTVSLKYIKKFRKNYNKSNKLNLESNIMMDPIAVKKYEEEYNLKLLDMNLHSILNNNGREFSKKVDNNTRYQCISFLSSGPKNDVYNKKKLKENKITNVENNKDKEKEKEIIKNNYVKDNIVDYKLLKLYRSSDNMLDDENIIKKANIKLLDLKEYKTGNSYLHKAILNNVYQLVVYLVHKGVNINSQNIIGETPMHIAIKKGFKDIISFLLNKGAILDIEDKNGRNAVYYADNEIKKLYNLENRLLLKKWNDNK